MTTQMTAEAREVLDTLIENRNEIANALTDQRRIISDSGWVVQSAGFYCRYTFGAGGSVTGVQAGSVLNASRMSEVNARHLATETSNGANIQPYAIHVIDALTNELNSLNEIINNINARFE